MDGWAIGIEVYNYPLSPCGEKVRMALAEKELPFVDIDVDLGSKANLKPDFLRLNPRGLVPVLAHGGTVVADSTVSSSDHGLRIVALSPSSASKV